MITFESCSTFFCNIKYPVRLQKQHQRLAYKTHRPSRAVQNSKILTTNIERKVNRPDWRMFVDLYADKMATLADYQRSATPKMIQTCVCHIGLITLNVLTGAAVVRPSSGHRLDAATIWELDPWDASPFNFGETWEPRLFRPSRLQLLLSFFFVQLSHRTHKKSF